MTKKGENKGGAPLPILHLLENKEKKGRIMRKTQTSKQQTTLSQNLHDPICVLNISIRLDIQENF